MRPINDTTIDELESIALEGARHLRAFFTYQGTNPQYFQKARLGAMAVSAYARIRASETNRMAVELAATKLLPSSPAQLPAAPKV